MKTTFRRGLTATASAALLLSAASQVPALATAPTPPVTAHDVTDPAEAARMNAVPVPEITWEECLGQGHQCANVMVPLSYDNPNGPKTRISVIKSAARKPAERIGMLLVNPGGPGGSAVQLAAMATQSLPPAVVDRFDIYGVEPRGIATSEHLECFKDEDEKKAIGDAWSAIDAPSTPEHIAKKKDLTAKYAQACMTTGSPLANSISTTNHVRDIELVRRATKEDTLSFFGFSYGTLIAQYYGNMFPERVRALAGDGVVDAQRWVGTANSPGTLNDRLGSSIAGKRALDKILELCVNPAMDCRFFSEKIAPPAKLAELEKRLIAKPVPAVVWGGKSITVDYATLYSALGELLYQANAPAGVGAFLEQIWRLTENPSSAAVRAEAQKVITQLDRAVHAPKPTSPLRQAPFKYDNERDVYQSVICTDGFHPATFEGYITAAENSKKHSAGFGPNWVWSTAVCARDNWTGSDPTRFTGPFTKRSKTPMLFIGNDWDPATPVDMAISAAAHTPGSGLVTSDGWGHTTSTTSSCVARALTKYLIDLTIPATPQRCKSDVKAFDEEAPRNSVPSVVKGWPRF